MKIKKILLFIIPLFILSSCGDSGRFRGWKEGVVDVGGSVGTDRYGDFSFVLQLSLNDIKNLHPRDELIDIRVNFSEFGLQGLADSDIAYFTMETPRAYYDSHLVSANYDGQLYIDTKDRAFLFFMDDIREGLLYDGYVEILISGNVKYRRGKVINFSFFQNLDLLID